MTDEVGYRPIANLTGEAQFDGAIPREREPDEIANRFMFS